MIIVLAHTNLYNNKYKRLSKKFELESETSSDWQKCSFLDSLIQWKWNISILKSLKKCRDLHSRYLRAKKYENKQLIYRRFKVYRNMIVTLIRKSKQNHFSKYFSDITLEVLKIPGKVLKILFK